MGTESGDPWEPHGPSERDFSKRENYPEGVTDAQYEVCQTIINQGYLIKNVRLLENGDLAIRYQNLQKDDFTVEYGKNGEFRRQTEFS